MKNAMLLLVFALMWSMPSMAEEIQRKPWEYKANCTAKTRIHAYQEVVKGYGKGESSRRHKAVQRAEHKALQNCRANVQRIGEGYGFRQRRINRIADRCQVRTRCRVKKPIIDFSDFF